MTLSAYEVQAGWTSNQASLVNPAVPAELECTPGAGSGSSLLVVVKRVLAGEVPAALDSLKAAEAARAEFTARFSKRTFGEAQNLPAISFKEHAETPLANVLTQILGFAPSNSAARRVAAQNGLRLIAEAADGEQHTTQLDEGVAIRPRQRGRHRLGSDLLPHGRLKDRPH
ncbi:hypothetical protein ACH4E7_04285 [Kitasatospora sp. NPDC018058]|uniref:hypothetical protein n=1 Tax=Kitasatospora sp. NPDC018058 TaxID=3364025 RepID=UPI0037C1AB3A